jgi:predicted dehydrogenase
MDQKQNSAQAGANTRREFLKTTATAAAVVATGNVFITPVYGQNQAPAPGRVIGSNDRITVGFIGVGGQGMAHVRSMKDNASGNNVELAAVCDVSKTRNRNARNTIGGNVPEFEDHRKLLENKDIDAVCISSVDHWHTIQTIDAMNAGKHVYVEKPMTRYLKEAFDIYDACQRTGKILTVGSQGSSDAKWHKAAELIRDGKIGPLVLGQGNYMRNNPKGEWNYGIADWATPEDMNWERWLGPVHKKIGFNADHYFRWRKYYPYCAGLLGDLIPHRLHPLLIATGNPEFPSRVTSLGNKAIGTDRNTPNTPERDVPETVQLLAEFPSGLTLMVISSTVNQVGLPDLIRGHMGTIYFGGNRVDLRPEQAFSDEVDPDEFTGIEPGESVSVHEKNWFDSIRANKQPNAGIDLAVKVQTIISLAEMSERLNLMCVFDEKSRKVTTGDGKVVEPITYGSLPLS